MYIKYCVCVFNITSRIGLQCCVFFSYLQENKMTLIQPQNWCDFIWKYEKLKHALNLLESKCVCKCVKIVWDRVLSTHYGLTQNWSDFRFNYEKLKTCTKNRLQHKTRMCVFQNCMRQDVLHSLFHKYLPSIS